MLFYLIIFTAFMAAFMFFYAVFGVYYGYKRVINKRLDAIAKDNFKERNSELAKPLFTRVISPFLDNMSKTILKVTPSGITQTLQKKIVTAGNPFNMTVKDWAVLQVVLAAGLPFITGVIGIYFNIDAGALFFICLFETGIGLLLPNLILSKSIADRQKKITKDLPDVLDILTVSVEAGLGFDGAISKVIEKMPGPLAEEFELVLSEIKVGRQKRDALKDMSERVNVQDMTTFVGSIIQADQLGVSIGNVLRIQSEQIRQKRRQRAREKAMKAPVKMLIPMILFIFPTIFSVLIGPVIVKVIDTFTK